MRRVVVPGQFYSEDLSPGVRLQRFYPGGKDGPNREVLGDLPGGQGWTEMFYLGEPEDGFQVSAPDIRLPANQYWPLHWHDCWTAVLVMEGQCSIGDWWMQPGDLLIVEPSLEYGPMVIGPHGCRLFEIFAQAHLSPGGYSPEYRDHPTLQGVEAVFMERSALNRRNAGRQIQPCDGVKGISKTRLSPGAHWDLGESGDPDRGVLQNTHLAPGERLAAHTYDDWHMLLVLAGSLKVTDRTLGPDDLLKVGPNGRVGEIEAGAEGVDLLELSRTARGMQARPI